MRLWPAQAMRFGDKAKQPSIATLERYGNTSASSTFYIMAYIEHHQGVQRGDKVLPFLHCLFRMSTIFLSVPGSFARRLQGPQVRRAVHDAAEVSGILLALPHLYNGQQAVQLPQQEEALVIADDKIHAREDMSGVMHARV